jgi:hypothetical protein
MFGTSIALTALLVVGMLLVAESLYRFRRDGPRVSQLAVLVAGAVLVLIAVAYAIPAPTAELTSGKEVARPPSVQPGVSPNYDTPARKRYKRKEGLDIGRYEA